MTLIRRLLFPLWIVRARLAARTGSVALVALGIAAGAGMLAAVLAGSLIAQDRGVARALERVAPPERALRAAWYGVPRQGGDYRTSLDPLVRRALRPLAAREPIRVMLYRQTRIAGHVPEGKPGLIDLGAVDGLGKWVRLRSGRLPRPCAPSRCEVLQLGGSGPIPSVPGLRLVRVGHATLTSEVPFGRIAPPGAYGSLVETARFFPSQTEPPPFLAAEGVAGLARAPELESIFRSYAWVVPIEPGSIRPWAIDDLVDKVTRARSALQTESPLFDLTAPVGELKAAAASTRIAGRRLLLIGGQAAALLLAFAVLSAASMRRDAEAAWRRLAWFGARRWQLLLFAASETAAVALAGTAVGWAAGAGLSIALADRAGSPARDILLHSIVSWRGLALAAGLAGAAALVLLVSLRARAIRLGAHSLSLLDVAALGALAAVVLALVRGEVDPRALVLERGTGAFLLLLPGLGTFAAAVVLARALAPVLRLLERLARRAPAPARLAALSLARSPGRSAIAVAFLAVSLGLALFAEGYRSTLDRGQRDQAAFAVPLDFVLREDLSKLVAPLQAAPLSRYRTLGADVETLPVIRLSGSVSRLGTGRGITILGIPARKLPTLRGWRSDFASLPPAELARRIEPRGPAELRGPLLPADARTLLLPVAVRGEDVTLTASVLTRRGDFAHVELGETDGSRRRVLRGQVPARARGGRVVSLSIGPTALSRETGEPLEGVLTLGRLAARDPRGRTTRLSDYRDWVGVNGIEAATAGGKTSLRYFVTNQLDSRFRPRQPTDGRPVPVVATPRLARAAGPGGILPLQRAGQRVSVRVVATARRFPSAEGDFVIADERLLGTALNADSPGSAVLNEIWLGVPSAARAAEVEAALRRPPFDVLRSSSRRSLESDLRSDPLARGALLTLAAAAAAALAVAIVGLLLSAAADLRDERGELFDLEAEGADPAILRRLLRLRAAFAAALGLLGGLGIGAALSALVVDLVALTANATAPEPPLLLEIDWRLVGLAVAGYVALATALVGAATWGAFRSPTPSRASGVEA